MKRQKITIALLIVISIAINCFNTPLQVHAKKGSKDSESYLEIESQEIGTNKTKKYKLKSNSDDVYVPILKGSQGKINKDLKSYSANRKDSDAEAVLDNDGRNEVTNTGRVPYRYIGQIVCTYKRKNNTQFTSLGTAFLVGESIILTCAHCVYSNDGTLVSAYFYPAQNGYGNRPYKYKCSTVHVPANYKTAIANNNATNKEKYDYAVVELTQKAGAKLGYFALGGYKTNYNDSYLIGKKCTVVGYPGEKAGKLYRHKGSIRSFNDGKYTMSYRMDTTPGQSGSPVIHVAKGQYYVVGIHRATNGIDQNYARYITKNIYELVKKLR